MCWYGINPPYKVPHVRSFTPIPFPLAYPYQYPIYPPYTIIGDLIGAPETVENALLEAYKDSKIDFEFEKLKDALDKDGNKKISFSEWNQVVGSLYTAVKLEDSGELTNQELLELLHLAILFEFNFHDKNQDGILTEFWVLFNDADTNRQGPLIKDGRNSCKWTGALVVLAKTFIMVKILVKIFEKYFLMDSFVDKRGYRSPFWHQIVAKS